MNAAILRFVCGSRDRGASSGEQMLAAPLFAGMQPSIVPTAKAMPAYVKRSKRFMIPSCLHSGNGSRNGALTEDLEWRHS
jgi:hypothetical protein